MSNFETESRRRLIAAVLLGSALLCVGYWTRAVLATGKATSVEEARAPVSVVAGTAVELARLLGAPRATLVGAALMPTERFRAIGVIASASGQGAALISIDKQPPKTFRVGASIAPGFVLKTVTQREIMLADSLLGAVTATLPLPDPATAKTDARNNNALSPLPTPQGPLLNAAEVEAGPPSLPSIRGEPRAP